MLKISENNQTLWTPSHALREVLRGRRNFPLAGRLVWGAGGAVGVGCFTATLQWEVFSRPRAPPPYGGWLRRPLWPLPPARAHPPLPPRPPRPARRSWPSRGTDLLISKLKSGFESFAGRKRGGHRSTLDPSNVLQHLLFIHRAPLWKL